MRRASVRSDSRGDLDGKLLGGRLPGNYLERYPDGYTCHFVRPGWKLPRRMDTVTS